MEGLIACTVGAQSRCRLGRAGSTVMLGGRPCSLRDPGTSAMVVAGQNARVPHGDAERLPILHACGLSWMLWWIITALLLHLFLLSWDGIAPFTSRVTLSTLHQHLHVRSQMGQIRIDAMGLPGRSVSRSEANWSEPPQTILITTPHLCAHLGRERSDLSVELPCRNASAGAICGMRDLDA